LANEVNRKRTYRSPRRQKQADETRTAILDGALSQFSTEGWARTKIAAIARAAGVSVETIYSVFGSKRGVLEALVQRAVRGDTPNIPLMEQTGPASVKAAQNPEQMIGLFARDISKVLSRVAPIMSVIRAAAEADPEMAPLYAGLHSGRRQNLRMFAQWLATATPLRNNKTAKGAAEEIWRLASPELYLLVTGIGGSSMEDYAIWLEQALVALLLPGPESAV
jgi:AcrR family transcriptional regulator